MPAHLTPETLGERWQRRPEWITQQAKAGLIPGAFKLGHLWRFPLEAIERFEARSTVADPLSMTVGSARRQGRKAS